MMKAFGTTDRTRRVTHACPHGSGMSGSWLPAFLMGRLDAGWDSVTFILRSLATENGTENGFVVSCEIPRLRQEVRE